MKRQLYYKKIAGINDINFYDLTQINWNEFKFTKDYLEHKLTEIETERFYLVMQQYYNDLFLEDIIFFINKIPDPLELTPGMIIRIPNIEDIRVFLKKYKIIL